MKRGSSLKCYVDIIGKDPNIKCVSFSALLAKQPNADFDGDELNLYIIMDETMDKLLEPFNPKNGTPNPNKPFGITKYLTLLSPGTNLVSEFLGDKSDNPSMDTILSKLNAI